MNRGRTKELLLILLILIILSSILLYGALQTRQSHAVQPKEERILVVSTFPGVSDDIRLLTRGCDTIKVVPLAPPGSDPHHYSLRPGDVKLLDNASLVVSTGHAPFEKSIAKYVPQDKLIVIPEIPGIHILRLPTGAVNLHMPIYDPRNYAVFMNYIAGKLETLDPNCSKIINKNKNYIFRNISILENYTNIMNGTPAVASSPLAEYPASWLGINITVYLSLQPGASAIPPDVIGRAEETLKNNGLAIIIVDQEGAPVGQVDKSLEALALKYNAKILKIPAPYLPEPTLDKLETIASQVK